MGIEKKHKKTNAKKVVATISLCALLGLGIGVGTGAYLVYQERETNYKEAASEFVKYTMREDNTLYLSQGNNDYAVPKYKKYTTITRGEYILEEIENRDILYCEFLDEFYTKDGRPIAFINKVDEDGEIIDSRVEIVENLLDPIQVNHGEIVSIVKSKPYSEIKDMDLVVKLPSYKPTQILVDGEAMYPGNLVLKR